MKCLITGGAGFIGSHLADRLLAEGHQVIALDNLITGSRSNISHLISNAQFRFIQHDCIQGLPPDLETEVIFHFASPASPPKYQQYPVETLLVNTLGTYQLLEYCKNHGARMIFASTSEIYGDPLVHPQVETYWGNVNPNGPRSCYDESKRAGEAFVAAYIRKFGIDARIIRIFNTFGPRMDIHDGRIVTNFIRQILAQQPLVIYGDGSQTRSLCYVSDLVEGIFQVFMNPAAKGEVFNLGNPMEQTVKEFADYITKLFLKPQNYKFLSLPVDDPKRRRPDITKATQILGWEPKVSLEDGLKKTITYFKQKPA